MRVIYPVCFYPWADGDGYTVEVPDLPGCISEGNDLDEAIYMIKDAATGWLLDEIENGKEVPSASNIEDIRLNEDGFIQLLEIEINYYG